MRDQVFIRPLVLAILLALIIIGCNRPSMPWSVLVLTVDTLRPDYMSANGYALPTTPYLDGLIREGFYFEEATSPIARTTPALAALMTGAYPHTTGVRTLTDSLREEIVPVAEVFREAGFQTMAVVTNQLLPPKRRLDRGFDVYDWQGDTRTAIQTTNRALDLIEQLDPARPVFLWIHYIDPHVPYHSTAELAESFDPGYEGRFEHNFGWQPQPGQSRKAFRPFPEELPKAVATHQNPLPEEVSEHIRRLYAADIRFFDNQVGRLVDGARARYGDTLIIVFAADHGESLGEHDYFFDHGDYTYNAGLQIPLAIVLPSKHPLHSSGRCPGWVSLVDVAPTLFDLLGREAPETVGRQMEGRSLMRCLEGESLETRPVFAESGHSFYFDHVNRRVRNDVAGRFRAVILDGWKLVLTPFLPDEEAWELFDLHRDPHEEENLFR
ncbi:MAG: sulfatase, partial [Thermoanaerobaculia bacterium]